MKPHRLPTEEEWAVWLGELPTQCLLWAIERKMQDLKNTWAGGKYTLPTIEGTALLNASKVGEMTTLAFVRDMTCFIEMQTEIGDDFESRPSSDE